MMNVYGRNNTYVDLVAPEGKYNGSCMQVFYMGRTNPVIPTESTTTAGRKPDRKLDDSFIKLYTYLHANDECQYSLPELKSLLDGFLSPADQTCITKWLKSKLQKHYKD